MKSWYNGGMATDNATGLLQIMNIDSWLTLIAVIVALGLGVSSLIQTQMLQKRERRERLLNEIIEWAIEINTVSLKTDLPKIDPFLELYIEEKAKGSQEIIESIKRNIVDKQLYRIEGETLLKYGIPFARNEYIRAIAHKDFKKSLQDKIDNAISVFTGFYFLEGEASGFKDAKQAFRGEALKTIEEIGKQIKEDGKGTDKLLTDYSEKLANSMTDLLTKIVDIRAKL